MKKILLTIGLIAATSAAFAQGFVNFAPSTYSVSTNGTQYSPLFGGGATGHGSTGVTAPANTSNLYYYELLIQHWTGTTPTDLNVWDGTWKDSGIFDTNHATVFGRVAPGPSALNVGTLVGWNAFSLGGNTFPNGTNYIILVGWSASLGTSWLQVSNACVVAAANPNKYFTTAGFFGESGIGWENPATASAAGIPLMGGAANAGGQPILLAGGMTLFEVPVPEPATFALVGLGGLSLLLFRRRK